MVGVRVVRNNPTDVEDEKFLGTCRCFLGIFFGLCFSKFWNLIRYSIILSTARWCSFCFGFPSHYILTSIRNQKCRLAAIVKGSGGQLTLSYFCMEYINSIIWKSNNLQWGLNNKIGQWLSAKVGFLGLKFRCPLSIN